MHCQSQDKLENLLRFFIDKFIGSESKMQEISQIQAKLLETYKPVKAARLVSMWLYVQRFGSSKAKEIFGTRTFYYAKRDLKKVGISFIDEPKVATTVDNDFLTRFTLAVPSSEVTNRVDDFRDSSNILNFVPRTSGMF